MWNGWMHLNLNLINREYEGWGGFRVLGFYHFCSCWLSYAGDHPLGSSALHIVTAICIWQEKRIIAIESGFCLHTPNLALPSKIIFISKSKMIVFMLIIHHFQWDDLRETLTLCSFCIPSLTLRNRTLSCFCSTSQCRVDFFKKLGNL